MSDIDLAAADHLLTTTKQVRQRLDLTRPVPRELLLECIDIASHAPMGGNLERNRWLVVDDPDLKAAIAEPYQAVGRPYLAANESDQVGARQRRVIDSATFLVEHIAEVPAMVIAVRLDRLADQAKNFEVAGYHGSVAPGVWSFQLAAARPRARIGLDDVPPGLRATDRRAARHPGLRHPDSRCSRWRTTPATPSTRRRDVRACEITYFNRWKQTLS